MLYEVITGGKALDEFGVGQDLSGGPGLEFDGLRLGALNRGVKQTLEAGAAAFRRGDLAARNNFV